MASFERDSVVVFYFFNTSESWPDEKGDLLWEWPYKRGDIVPTLLNQCLPYSLILSFYLTLTLHIFRFATQAKNALLFYNGRFNEQHDFLALEIIDEQVQFSFSLGGNITVVNTNIQGGISTGEWTWVSVNYLNRVSNGLVLHISTV